jgi:hypothetical protein
MRGDGLRVWFLVKLLVIEIDILVARGVNGGFGIGYFRGFIAFELWIKADPRSYEIPHLTRV